MITELLSKGYIILRNQNQSNVDRIISELGTLLYTQDVTIMENSRGLVTSEKALDYHTDHHKTKYIILHCIEQTDIGGESILIDALNIYRKMDISLQKELELINLFEHKIFEDDKEFYPLVSKKDDEIRFYYSFWLVDDLDRNNLALKKFQELIKIEKHTEFKLDPNDILIIDNHRMLHGRKEIAGNKQRLLKRYWIN